VENRPQDIDQGGKPCEFIDYEPEKLLPTFLRRCSAEIRAICIITLPGPSSRSQTYLVPMSQAPPFRHSSPFPNYVLMLHRNSHYQEGQSLKQSPSSSYHSLLRNMEPSLELCSVPKRIELSLFLLLQALVPNNIIQQKLLRKQF
jgi:hypothetical protein